MTRAEQVTLADGTALSLLHGGDPDAEVTVLLAHGYALDHRCWEPIAGLLPTAVEFPVRVIAYDHRGHGRSSAATKRTATVERLGDDLAELIDLLVPDGPVVLVGHAMGGLVALALCARHPELVGPAPEGRVRGLVLMSTGAGEMAAEVRAATGMAVESGSGVPSVVNKLMWDLEAVVGSKFVDLVTDRAHKAAVTATRWSLFGENPAEDHLVLTLRMIRHHWPKVMAMFRPGLDNYVKKAALNVPEGVAVSALVGERDRLVPPEHAAALVARVPDANVVVLPTLGHMLPLEGTAQVLPRIASVVNEVRRTSRDAERGS